MLKVVIIKLSEVLDMFCAVKFKSHSHTLSRFISRWHILRDRIAGK